MHIVDKNYIALFDHGIKMLATYQLYILDPRFVPRLSTSTSTSTTTTTTTRNKELRQSRDKTGIEDIELVSH